MNGRRHTTAASAVGSSKLDAPENRSRPSKTNCTPEDTAAESTESESPQHWWRRKNELVDRFIEEMPNRASRPISVRGGTKVRDECSLERGGSENGYRAKTWSAVLNEFLQWYNGYRDAHLVFESPEGEEVTTEMENSHQPSYGDTYYARLKAFERQVVAEYENPHSVMLTFSGSSRNGNGGWRSPSDHMRDVVESWRPDRGRGVYHTLREVLNGRDWEYALVVERHKSGYGHVHCAVFVDGAIDESDFHPVVDAHLRQCSIAHRDAHDYYSPNEDDRPISVKRIDPNGADVDAIGNLGSYVGAYIGSYGEPLFERDIDELIFRAAVWATGTQVVRFSNGANEMIARERERAHDDPDPEVVRPNPDFDPDLHANTESDVSPIEVDNPAWSLAGIMRKKDDEEVLFTIRQSGIVWREIEDASGLDPPNPQPPDRPRPHTADSDLSRY